jgi:hypothetical protein
MKQQGDRQIMASENKTQKTDASVTAYLDSVENERRRQDGYALLEMMREETGEEPAMWGDSMVGFGSYHYKYESGREGDMMAVGFSPRKQALSVYIMPGFKDPEYEALLSRLGKHRTGASCLYINKLSDVDQDVLRQMVARSYEIMKDKKLNTPADRLGG